MLKNKKLLFIGAHPDDVEFACGGTISKFKDVSEIYIVALSPCCQSVPHGFEANAIENEFYKSINIIKPTGFYLYDFLVRNFDTQRQIILDVLLNLKNEIKPDVVFFHSDTDVHQDHKVVFNECNRAFKDVCMITYDLPFNCLKNEINLIIELSENHIKNKLKYISCYETQKDRYYMSKDFIKALLVSKGILIKSKYAETFKIIKWKN